MTVRTVAIAIGVGAGLLLSGCDQVKKLAGGKPTGQVVATVDGEEITTLQLRAELGNFSTRDPEVMKRAQQQALQRIIMRKLVADAAKEEKLDKTPDYTLQLERGEETLLAQLFQRKLAGAVAQPTRAEAEKFIASNPNMFANRRVMLVDQLVVAPNKIPVERFQPLNTLEEVKALLDAESVPYQESAVLLDTLSANPQLVRAVDQLPAGEVFVLPQGGALLFNRIAESRSVPFRGEPAVNVAMNALRSQRAQEVVTKRMEALRKQAESKITYNPAYKPPPPAPKGKAPPAKGAAAPGPAAPTATGAPTAAPAATPAAPSAPAAVPSPN